MGNNIQGKKIREENGYEIYLYPEVELTEEEMEKSINILVIGETGTGKTTFLQALSNYFRKVKFSRKIRYNLLDEVAEKAEKNKESGFSVTDNYKIYNIKPLPFLSNIFHFKIFDDLYPIYRIIDTPGFGDTRGEEMDNLVVEQIRNLFSNEGIKHINAICFVFKESVTRLDLRMKYIMKNLLQLFGKNVVDSIVFLLTFSSMRKNMVKEPFNVIFSKDSPFHGIIEENDAKFFQFDNGAFFCNYDRNDQEDVKETEKSFNMNMDKIEKFLNFVKENKGISIKESAEVLNNRYLIKSSMNNSAICIKNLSSDLSMISNNDRQNEENRKKELLENINNKLLECIQCFSNIIIKEMQLQKVALYPGDNQFLICKNFFVSLAKSTNDQYTREFLLLFSDNIDKVKSACEMKGNDVQKIAMMKSILNIII